MIIRGLPKLNFDIHFANNGDFVTYLYDNLGQCPESFFHLAVQPNLDACPCVDDHSASKLHGKKKSIFGDTF